ncbi:histidine kinase [Gordonia sp. CPCC 205515]|uniref:sensor histidine kinase n=1 Tax=Gordonia sp. CPCC 205515 TaxID=3140791 RepID=UPI003AF3CFE2
MTSLAATLRHRIQLAGGDYPPIYSAIMLCGCLAITIVAVAQRFPFTNPWWVVAGLAWALASLALDLIRPRSIACGFPTIVATVCFLMTPAATDVAPLMMALSTAIAAAMYSLRVSLVIAGLSTLVIAVFAGAGMLASPAAYVLAIAVGWLAGYMVLIQKRLADNQIRVAEARAEQAASDERRRIAREIHDVIAHSLSITMLNVTGARHALSSGGDLDEALEALSDAERQGRRAMTEIRQIVQVLGTDGSHAPTPGADDLPALIDDYRRAGIDVDFAVTGSLDRLPTPVGAALYRIVQESLANVAKHTAAQHASVIIEADGADVGVRVENPYADLEAESTGDGSGIPGMIQRAETLGGRLEVTRESGMWSVRATLPTSMVAEHGAGS